VAEFMVEVARFQEWATAIPQECRHGEWECDYGHWGDLYGAALRLVDATPFARWSAKEVRAMLFTVARDNEMQHLAGEVRSRKPETLVALARAAVESEERDAQWQLAEELGQLGQCGGEAERLLLALVRDGDEYVRRRSLQALARLSSPAVEQLALAEWHRPEANQQWARMNVLWYLHRVGSPSLPLLLAEAETDERPHLSDFALKVQLGEVHP
jgi:HEAT repeat protein